jgi:HK97 gp10 family phage protein
LPSLVSGKNAIARALRKGAEPIRVRAGELAPRDPETSEHGADTMMIAVRDQTATGARAEIGPSRQGFYLGQQETGNINHSAQPHLRPAFDEKISEATSLIGQTLASEIEKALKK